MPSGRCQPPSLPLHSQAGRATTAPPETRPARSGVPVQPLARPDIGPSRGPRPPAARRSLTRRRRPHPHHSRAQLRNPRDRCDKSTDKTTRQSRQGPGQRSPIRQDRGPMPTLINNRSPPSTAPPTRRSRRPGHAGRPPRHRTVQTAPPICGNDVFRRTKWVSRSVSGCVGAPARGGVGRPGSISEPRPAGSCRTDVAAPPFGRSPDVG
jgi:hypothetical protein